MKTILVAVGIPAMEELINSFKEYKIIGTVNSKKELILKTQSLNPEIVLIGETLYGNENTIELLLSLKTEFPGIRIVYLAGEIDPTDKKRVATLGSLVMAGIYDIYHEKTIKTMMLKHLLDCPKTKESVLYLVSNSQQQTEKIPPEHEIVLDLEETYIPTTPTSNNITLFSSIKPGSGKSFLTTNTGIAIAKYGEHVNGRPPKVALIEGDLQNLSVGTLLRIEHERRNLYTALMAARSVIDRETGEIIADLPQVETARNTIKDCLLPYSEAKNLFALTGSNLSVEKVEDSTVHEYIFILQTIMPDYDVIIIDSNSSLYHSTAPLAQVAKNLFYVIDLDYNNLRNNKRYQGTLKMLGLLDKARYILNQGMNDPELLFGIEQARESFNIAEVIPMIEKTLFLNAVYSGLPIVLSKDQRLKPAQEAILKLANQIWPIYNKQILNDSGNQKKLPTGGIMGLWYRLLYGKDYASHLET